MTTTFDDRRRVKLSRWAEPFRHSGRPNLLLELPACRAIREFRHASRRALLRFAEPYVAWDPIPAPLSVFAKPVTAHRAALSVDLHCHQAMPAWAGLDCLFRFCGRIRSDPRDPNHERYFPRFLRYRSFVSSRLGSFCRYRSSRFPTPVGLCGSSRSA